MNRIWNMYEILKHMEYEHSEVSCNRKPSWEQQDQCIVSTFRCYKSSCFEGFHQARPIFGSLRFLPKSSTSRSSTELTAIPPTARGRRLSRAEFRLLVLRCSVNSALLTPCKTTLCPNLHLKHGELGPPTPYCGALPDVRQWCPSQEKSSLLQANMFANSGQSTTTSG